MTSSASSTFFLPLVDISPFVEDPESAAGRQIVQDVRHACVSTGFFQLVGHQVPESLQKQLFEGAAKFFALPLDVKQALDFKKDLTFHGYEAMESQSFGEDTLADSKESFIVGVDLAADDPRVLSKRFFAGPNVWPDVDMLPRSEFRDIVEQYYLEMIKLSSTVLQLVAATLPYGPQIFDDIQANEPSSPLRLHHYPQTPVHVEGQKRQFGSSPHTDFGTVTLLLQDENSGLEVLDQATQTWVGVPPRKDAYVINMGDLMTKITGGKYKSSVHRVLNQVPTDRYSAAFFFNGNNDYQVRELDKTGTAIAPGEDVFTVEDYVLGRAQETFKTQATS